MLLLKQGSESDLRAVQNTDTPSPQSQLTDINLACLEGAQGTHLTYYPFTCIQYVKFQVRTIYTQL